MSRAQRSDIDRFVAHRIKELRLCAGITQHQVGQQLGVSDQQVHKFENGKNRISGSQLLAIARLFDMPVSEFFHGYEGGAPRHPFRDFRTSRMLLNVTRRFLELEPEHQDALLHLARAMAGSSRYPLKQDEKLAPETIEGE